MEKWGGEGCVANCALLCIEERERTSSELLDLNCTQVRAAAVFALGTYVLNRAGGDGDDDHTSSINQNVGMTLLNVLHDGSPVVRKVGGASVVLPWLQHCM